MKRDTIVIHKLVACFLVAVIFVAPHPLISKSTAASEQYLSMPAATPDSSIIQPIIPLIPLIPTLCPINLPDPVVSVVGTENYTANGNAWVRYLLTVVNRHEYPDSLFSPAPDLPPCGLNTNSSRTWVNILDQNNKYIYGFCALGSAEDLSGLWFAVAAGTDPPPAVRVILNDRLCEKEYRSELVEITPYDIVFLSDESGYTEI